MKKILFLFTMVLGIAIISGGKQSAQNEKGEKYAKQATLKDFNGINKLDVRESKSDRESFKPKETTEGVPRILFMLYNDPGLAVWSPSFWWSFQRDNTGKPGC